MKILFCAKFCISSFRTEFSRKNQLRKSNSFAAKKATFVICFEVFHTEIFGNDLKSASLQSGIFSMFYRSRIHQSNHFQRFNPKPFTAAPFNYFEMFSCFQVVKIFSAGKFVDVDVDGVLISKDCPGE